MARKQKAKVRIEADDKASREIKKVQGSLSKLGSFVKRNLTRGLIAATAAVVGFTLALKKATGASDKQYAAILKLETALGPLDGKLAQVSKELQAHAAALQKVTTAGDEVIIAGQALIASFTKDTEKIKGATKAALDLSAATGQSLQSAFLLLGRAVAGETSMLSRYGITLDESIPKSEKFAAALVKIEEQFGGQAQAQAKTYSGLLAQIGNAYGDLWEKVGDGITKNEALKRALEGLVEVLQGKKVAELIEGVGVAIGTMTTKTVDAITYIGDLGRALKEYADELARVREETQAAADTTDVADNAFARLGDNLQRTLGYKLKTFADLMGGNVLKALRAVGKGERELADANLAALNSFLALQARVVELSAVHAAAAEKAKLHADAEERLKRILSEEAEAIKDATDAARALGITLESEVTAKHEKLVLAVDKVRAAYDANLAKWQDVLNAEAALKKATEEATQALGDEAVAIEASGTAAAGAVGGVDSLTDSTNRLTTAEQRNAAATRQTTQARIAAAQSAIVYRNAQGAQGPGLPSRIAQRQAEVDAALAAGNVPIMGGTKIRLPGGGSRLVGTRRF